MNSISLQRKESMPYKMNWPGARVFRRTVQDFTLYFTYLRHRKNSSNVDFYTSTDQGYNQWTVFIDEKHLFMVQTWRLTCRPETFLTVESPSDSCRTYRSPPAHPKQRIIFKEHERCQQDIRYLQFVDLELFDGYGSEIINLNSKSGSFLKNSLQSTCFK